MVNLDCIFRILEFESTGIPVGNKEVSCEVELWDCSGDQKYDFIFSGILKSILKFKQILVLSFAIISFDKTVDACPSRFENCWPAIQKDANGVLFVYNPDNTSHGKELETL